MSDRRTVSLVRTLIRTASRPAAPPGLGPGQRRGRVGLLGFPLVRRKPDQAKPHLVSCRDRELRGDCAVPDVKIDRGAEGERFRSGNRYGAAGQLTDEGNAVPIVEPRVQLEPHWDAPAQAFDEADDIGTSFPGQHAVDDAHRTLWCLEVRLQDQASLAGNGDRRASWRRREQSTIDRCSHHRGAPRNRLLNRSAESTANRWSRYSQRGQQFLCLRRWRSLRCGAPSRSSFPVSTNDVMSRCEEAHV